MSSIFSKTASSRILILDGAMGTMIQRRGFGGDSLRGEPMESLNLKCPEVIRDIHAEYIAAGADIIETNSFGANRITQEEYGLSDKAPEIARAAARIARAAADAAGRKVWVAGSVGPGGKSLSIGPDASDPSKRQYDFDDLSSAYGEQIAALVEGGADLILLETWFDALNAKAAIFAFEKLGAPVPLMISATVSDRSGRTLTGQTLEAFFHSVRHAPGLVAFGVNCALGAAQMVPLVREIASFSDLPLVFYPNAGLPDGLGQYSDGPETMAATVARLASDGLLNIVGGCCGTTPEHIAAIASAVRGIAPRTFPERREVLCVSGLDTVTVERGRNFTNVGERTNVAGSRKFARLIAEKKYDEALQVAAAQIEGGADIIDVNLDDAMLDSRAEMRTFLRYISSDPSVARAAIMIDSSHWDTIEEALKNVQGRSIVNSISLKDGEKEFIRRARHIRDMGAAMVVMAFDEKGQATDFVRKTEICARSYDLLTRVAGVSPQDIIFDVNVLTVGTGIPEHAKFGVDYIEAVRWIKQNLPGALTSGGISNLSFAFRGNNAVREAMHSAFIYHAVEAGLDMAIVNPQMLQVYDAIEPSLLHCVEDVIFDSDPGATERLVEKASEVAAAKDAVAGPAAETPSGTPAERVSAALVKGDMSSLEADVLGCYGELGTAVAVIEGPLMDGMEKVGELFAQGRMCLPQVVKSARVMRSAVAVLEPYMKVEDSAGDRPKVVIATVKGDVHDIGKNITSIVLQCGGFEVVDLGVMVPAEDILAKAEEIGADIIGVSGLITPSLYRMEELCREMSARGLTVPLFVGGAAASAVHTAVKLRPLYANVHYGADASATAVMAKKYISDPESFMSAEEERYERLAALRKEPASESGPAEPYPEDSFVRGCPFEDLPLQTWSGPELMKFFDWKFFDAVCRNHDSESLRGDAQKILEGLSAEVCARFYECFRDGDDIVSSDGGLRLPMLRQGHSLADFFPEKGGSGSPLGLFAVRVPDGCHCSCGCEDILEHAVRVTLAEAASAAMAARFASATDARVIMPGIGYACCPDHSLKRIVLAELPVDVKLTESCAMIPEASICGLVIAHPEARYTEIHRLTAEAKEKYASRRGFTEEEKDIFLNFL